MFRLLFIECINKINITFIYSCSSGMHKVYAFVFCPSYIIIHIRLQRLISIFPFVFYHFSHADFLLHPFRKPKRVRTAFSPGQLLKLEHAFESNQYVVGAERKQLAQALNLSETQVIILYIY